jgi:hypothetical protein
MLATLPVKNLITTDSAPIFCQNLERNISASTELKKMKMLFYSQFNTTTFSHSFADRPLPTPQEYYKEYCEDARKARFFTTILSFEDPKMQEAITFLHQKNLKEKEHFLEAKKTPLKSLLEPAMIQSLTRGIKEVHPDCLENLSIEVTFAKTNAPEQDLSICFLGNPRPKEGSIVNLFRLKTPSRLGQFFFTPIEKIARTAFALLKWIVSTMAYPFQTLPSRLKNSLLKSSQAHQ